MLNKFKLDNLRDMSQNKKVKKKLSIAPKNACRALAVGKTPSNMEKASVWKMVKMVLAS